MKFLQLGNISNLIDLAKRVGTRNVATVLATNGLSWLNNISSQFQSICETAVSGKEVGWQQKFNLLNKLTQDSDIFEFACHMSESGWKILNTLGTLPNMLKIPETVYLPPAIDILGNGIPILNRIYQKISESLQGPQHYIDLSAFDEYSTIRSSPIDQHTSTSSNVFEWFKIPWGEVVLYSSLSDSSISFPVYPKEVSDSRSANYTTMPDMLYQYEPWQIYQSSGPRQNSYSFDFHRDMWTGDHRDGKANELIRFCEANTFPKYQGSAVNVATVSLYVAGKLLISGVLTGVETSWDGPIGLDGWYLHCVLTLRIVEVSPEKLNYDSVKAKPLIG